MGLFGNSVLKKPHCVPKMHPYILPLGIQVPKGAMFPKGALFLKGALGAFQELIGGAFWEQGYFLQMCDFLEIIF